MRNSNALMDYIDTEIKIITTLLDNFEYFKHGLCRLAYDLMKNEIIDGYMYDSIDQWLEDELPEFQYELDGTLDGCVFVWRDGDVDSRRYWLKNKLVTIVLDNITSNFLLKMCENNKTFKRIAHENITMAEFWIQDRQGNVIASAKGGPEYKDGTKLK